MGLPPSRPHGAVSWLVGLLLWSLTGCAGVVSADPLAPAPAVAVSASASCPSGRVAAVELPVRLVPGLGLQSQSDERSRAHVTTPVLPGAGPLNERIRSRGQAALADYGRLASGRPGQGELNVSWSLTGVSPAVVGVALRQQRSLGDETVSAVDVVWFDRATRRLINAIDLFSATGWTQLQLRLAGDSCPGDSAVAVRAATETSAATGLAVQFTAGGALVLTSAALGPAARPVVIDAATSRPLLSDLGRAAAAAATSPQPLPSTTGPTYGPTMPTVGPPAPPPTTPTPKATLKPKVAPKLKPKPKPAPKKPAPKKKAAPPQPSRVDCRRARCVALTFDDGPGPYTAALLLTLRREHAAATFFMIGEHVDAYPGLARQVARDGFEIGNHTYTHPDLTRLSAAEARSQLTRTSRAIRRATGRTPVLLRPPYGARNRAVDREAAAAGLAEVLWSVDTLDWLHQHPASVQAAVRSHTRRGSIVLMHDIHPTTVKAVPGVVRDLRRRGYTLVTVSQLVGSTRPGSLTFSGR